MDKEKPVRMIEFPENIMPKNSHGNGTFNLNEFKYIGQNVIIESGVLIFHVENIIVGNNIYIGHQSILKGYHKNLMIIGDNTWIGQQCFFHSAGGLTIGKSVGIGPKVTILSSQHRPANKFKAVLHSKIEFKEVVLKDGCDIGCNATILPGVTIGFGAIIGAGAVVNKNVPDFEIWAGIPAKKIAERE